MSTVPLPTDPDLAQLKTQARELQRRVRDGDDAALAEVALRHPDGAPPPEARPDFALSAAQLVLARRHGFASWPRLVEHIGVVHEHTRRPADIEPSTDPAHELVRLACLHYGDDDHQARWDDARSLLGRHPALARSDLAVAAATVDLDAVLAHLERDPGAAARATGPMDWEPILYLAYSRIIDGASEAGVVAVGAALLDHGADPNAGYLWRGLPSPFTALTGCFGEGELGPERQPRHACGVALARLLLDRGADPNDSQTLYNRQFHADDSHLVLLFEFGLGRGDGGPWKRRLGPALASPAEMVRDQLRWALLHQMADRVRLLAANGVDLASPFADGRTPAEVAALNGDAALLAVLDELGAPAPGLEPVDAVIAAIMAGDRAEVERVAALDPGALARARAERPGLVVWAAASGRVSAVEAALDEGFAVDALARSDVPVEQPWETALHVAAMAGDLELIGLLLDRGADPTIRDGRFQGRPLEWARHGERPDAVALLEAVTPDGD
jgi:hypothetical protein